MNGIIWEGIISGESNIRSSVFNNLSTIKKGSFDNLFIYVQVCSDSLEPTHVSCSMGPDAGQKTVHVSA